MQQILQATGNNVFGASNTSDSGVLRSKTGAKNGTANQDKVWGLKSSGGTTPEPTIKVVLSILLGLMHTSFVYAI